MQETGVMKCTGTTVKKVLGLTAYNDAAGHTHHIKGLWTENKNNYVPLKMFMHYVPHSFRATYSCKVCCVSRQNVARRQH